MKFAIAALVAVASAGLPPSAGLGHPISQPPEKTLITPRVSGLETGLNIEPLIQTTKTAPSLSPTTGKVPNNAPNPGNAEALECAREADGAPAMTDVREPHSQTKLQVSSQIIDQPAV